MHNISQLRALCACVRTKDIFHKILNLLPFSRSVLTLLGYCYYYYYYLRSTCMYICKVVCISIQLLQKNKRRSS